MKTRSFKLIKSYPNSENVGSVYTKTDLCENYWYYTNCLSPADVEDNPEFFEEIIERQPLLVTHDGVELFEGDSVWGFYRGYGKIFEMKDLQRAREEQWLKFSSYESAENHISWNTPILSLRDVASIYPGINKEHNSPSHQAELLKTLVKSRL